MAMILMLVSYQCTGFRDLEDVLAELAINGGHPVRGERAWPSWPEIDDKTDAKLLQALHSRRWAISWPGDGTKSNERQFAEQFAAYCDRPFCIPVDHGSSALVVALQGLGIGPGDEVIVPVLTWVASASAVLRVGALPILADVDPRTGCLSPAAVVDALSPRTRAIIAVHLGSTIAELDKLMHIADAAGLHLIEDCAQAHGARWGGRAVGSWGVVGAFSFQHGKVLAAGEGGAVVTGEESLYLTMQQLRADSRAYLGGAAVPGEMELVELGETMGVNYSMSELHAAVLLDQLSRLDAQHERRERFAQELEEGLSALGGFAPVPLPEAAERRSIYEYGIRFEPGTFGVAPVERIAAAVGAELRRRVYPPDVPLNRSVLFRPGTTRRYSTTWTSVDERRSIGRDYPNAESFRETTLLLHHAALLGDSADVRDILDALDKVRAQAAKIPIG